METVIAAILSGVVTLIGVLIANSRSNAVMEYKIEELTREVRKHNGFAEKIPESMLKIKSSWYSGFRKGFLRKKRRAGNA